MMKRKLLFIMILVLSAGLYAQSEKAVANEIENNKCFSCHQESEYLPEDFNKGDIHFTAGITCADCHGGNINTEDADDAMSASKGFVGVPDKRETPKFCGKCHSNINFMKKYSPRIETDQVARYYTSVHGIQLKKGDENIAVCTDCHTAHSIFAAKDPRSSVYAVNVPKTCNKCHGDEDLMSQYGIESSVYNDYAKGVHGKALLEEKDTGAPACNDCHGNHGATPPGVLSISYVCGLCHVNNFNYFKESRMGKAFVENDFHGCVECHSNHDIKKPNDNLVGTSDDAFCTNCHSEGEKAYKAAKSIHNSIASLKMLYDSAQVKLEEVKRKGMNDEDIEYILKDVNQSLIQARTTVHTFDTNKVLEKTNAGKESGMKAISQADAQIEEYFTRRNGFAAATAAITIFIIGLYLKIRDMSKKKV